MERRVTEYAGKHLLLVGTGGVKRRRVLTALRALGLGRLSCLHDRPNWAAPLIDDWIEGDSTRWSPRTLEVVRKRLGTVDGVLTWDDYSVVVAAHLAEGLGRIGIAPEAAMRAKDKSAFRQLCRDHGLPAPRFVRIESQSSDFSIALLAAKLLAAGVTYPVVVKPTHGAGSVLVRRADDLAELHSTLLAYRRNIALEPAAALWPDESVLVEEYLAGTEVDIDMLLQDGVLRYAQVTDNFAPREPCFMELGGQIPSALPTLAQDELVRVAHQVLAALGVSDGCVHFEARWTERGAVPIEANLRLGGAEVYEFNRCARGVDLVLGAARIALGLPVPIDSGAPQTFLRSTAFIPPCSGALRSIHVAAAVKRDAALCELVIFHEVGDSIRVPPEGFDHLGWMVARGRNRAQADANLARLCAGIRFEIGAQSFHGAWLPDSERLRLKD